MLAPTEDLQKALYDEMLARLNETDSSVPVQRDEYFYYTRTEKGRQYEIYCRKRALDAATADAPEEILLDENALADGHAYFALGAREVSPDHRLLAYTIDLTGGESFELYVMDLADTSHRRRTHSRALVRRRVGQRQPDPLLHHSRHADATARGAAPRPRTGD